MESRAERPAATDAVLAKAASAGRRATTAVEQRLGVACTATTKT
ncbi:hypothetical protein [Streptomyces sp. NPDC051364]